MFSHKYHIGTFSFCNASSSIIKRLLRNFLLSLNNQTKYFQWNTVNFYFEMIKSKWNLKWITVELSRFVSLSLTKCTGKGNNSKHLKIYWWYGSSLTLYLQFMSHCHITTHHFGKHTQKFTYNFSFEKGFWKSSDRDKSIGHFNFDQAHSIRVLFWLSNVYACQKGVDGKNFKPFYYTSTQIKGMTPSSEVNFALWHFNVSTYKHFR